MYILKLYLDGIVKRQLYYSDIETAISDILKGTIFDIFVDTTKSYLTDMKPTISFSTIEHTDMQDSFEFRYTDDICICVGRIITEESKHEMQRYYDEYDEITKKCL